jgi:SLT domain-containing protein
MNDIHLQRDTDRAVDNITNIVNQLIAEIEYLEKQLSQYEDLVIDKDNMIDMLKDEIYQYKKEL